MTGLPPLLRLCWCPSGSGAHQPHCLVSLLATPLPPQSRLTMSRKAQIRKTRCLFPFALCPTFSSFSVFVSYVHIPISLPLSWPPPCQILRQWGPLLTTNALDAGTPSIVSKSFAFLLASLPTPILPWYTLQRDFPSHIIQMLKHQLPLKNCQRKTAPEQVKQTKEAIQDYLPGFKNLRLSWGYEMYSSYILFVELFITENYESMQNI